MWREHPHDVGGAAAHLAQHADATKQPMATLAMLAMVVAALDVDAVVASALGSRPWSLHCRCFLCPSLVSAAAVVALGHVDRTSVSQADRSRTSIGSWRKIYRTAPNAPYMSRTCPSSRPVHRGMPHSKRPCKLLPDSQGAAWTAWELAKRIRRQTADDRVAL